MQSLAASQILEVWERGLSYGPVRRALELAAVACPGSSFETLSALSIGRRDAILLTLRESTFGSEIAATVLCPRCGNQLELAFTVDQVRATPPTAPEFMCVTVDGYDLQLRLPNSFDLAALIMADPEHNRALLFQRCVLDARYRGAPTSPGQLPPAVVEEAARLMSEADPQADVQLNVACPACEHRWRAAFDIVSFLWTEIEIYAARLLREIHLLAAAYGWAEREILALGNRRQFYLEMISA